MSPERGEPERIVVVGASGSGKTTLAAALGESLRLPVHNLDNLAREGGGTGPETSTEHRRGAVDRILASGHWIAEGVHLGWTEPLLEAADIVIWLDHVTWTQASRGIIRRFAAQALAEMRRQKGLRKITRVRDYARRLGELLAAIPEARAYERASSDNDLAGREATARRMAALGDKVVHCRTSAEVRDLASGLTSRPS